MNVRDLKIPFPHVQGVADGEEFFLPVQSELVEGLGTCLPPKALNSGLSPKAGLRLLPHPLSSLHWLKDHRALQKDL